jgi:hypothetical protein
MFSTTRLVPSPTASAATEAAVTDGLAAQSSTTTEAAEAAGGDTGGTIFVVTIVPIFTGEPFGIHFLCYILLSSFLTTQQRVSPGLVIEPSTTPLLRAGMLSNYN